VTHRRKVRKFRRADTLAYEVTSIMFDRKELVVPKAKIVRIGQDDRTAWITNCADLVDPKGRFALSRTLRCGQRKPEAVR